MLFENGITKSYEVKGFDTKQAVISTESEIQNELAEARECLNCCLTAEQILLESNTYDKGLAALHKNDRDEWLNEWLSDSSAEIEEEEEDDEEYEDDEEDDNYTATTEGLLDYIDNSKKDYEKFIYELENRSKVKQQILGKSFFSDNDMNKFIKYENHLDKKFEKTLAMLLKLKELRLPKQL